MISPWKAKACKNGADYLTLEDPRVRNGADDPALAAPG